MGCPQFWLVSCQIKISNSGSVPTTGRERFSCTEVYCIYIHAHYSMIHFPAINKAPYSVYLFQCWHLAGTLCVLVSFPFLFLPAFGLTIDKDKCAAEGKCTRDNQIVTLYYSAFVVLFRFGWATIQVSHLSMIPDMTSCEKSRYWPFPVRRR